MPGIEYHYTEPSGMELVLASKIERRYPWHIHAKHWTAGMIFSGAAAVETRKGALLLGKGDHFVVRPYEAHRLCIKPESVFAAICLDASKEPLFPQKKLNAALQAFQAAQPQTKMASLHVMTQLNTLGRLLLSQTSYSHGEMQGRGTPVQKVLQLLTAKPEEPIPIAEMAVIAGYSPWHLIRCFQKETGMTPHAFQLACKLHRIRLLLRKKTAAVEAAICAGFADQSHMHKVFKQHHALTPRQFLQASFCLKQEYLK